MKDFVKAVLDLLDGKVDYGEVRVVLSRSEDIIVKNGEVDHLAVDRDEGFGVRVFIDGYMGFASSHLIAIDEAQRVVERAIKIAKASARAGGPRYTLSPLTPQTGSYRTPIEKDPFEVPLETKIELLLAVDEVLAKEPKVKLRVGSIDIRRHEKYFGSTDGSLWDQVIYHTGAGYTAYAMDGGEVQQRSYPAPHGGNMAAAGWEFIEEMELVQNAERVAEEAAALLSAPEAPVGEMDLVLGTHQMVLQIHESIGHALELDRVLGYEASYAGTSFATLEKLGSFRYGSELLNIVADSLTPRGLGTYGWDDEGVPAQRNYLIKDGILVGYLSSRDTAPAIGRQSIGAARASSWNRIPIVRMINVSLEPGDLSFDELIGEVKEGIYLDANKSWSIDQKRLNFQFGTEIGWVIKNGKLSHMVKNPLYWGITPQFWAKMDGVGDKESWRLWGIPNCGKGEPGQTMTVGHGTPPARFRGVSVGRAK